MTKSKLYFSHIENIKDPIGNDPIYPVFGYINNNYPNQKPTDVPGSEGFFANNEDGKVTTSCNDLNANGAHIFNKDGTESNTSIMCDDATINKFTCKDSDNGQDYYVQGTLSVNEELWFTPIDACQGDGYTLKEFYCDKANKLNSKLYYCMDGCQNGVCIVINDTFIGGTESPFSIGGGGGDEMPW